MRGYDTAEYASSRLVDTVIMYDKTPVLVMAVGKVNGEITVSCTRLLDKENSIINVPLSRCDINPVSLGYVNYKKAAYYIMRAPMRRDWRQGLRMMNIVDPEGGNPRLLPYNVIAQTILGNYPSFKSSLEQLNSKNKATRMAFCRDFSISSEGELTYKGLIDVGKVNMNSGNILINDNCRWVGEALNESMEAA